MRPTPNPLVEPFRIRTGPKASDASYGNNGAFHFPGAGERAALNVIASDGAGWEHVSVSSRGRCPTWEEMCYVKDLFWSEDEAVVQYHPPEAVYVKCHPYVLHLWKPVMGQIPMPPIWMVGPVGVTLAP